MNIQNLSTLRIHQLTQEQYDREKAAGNLEANAIYLVTNAVGDVPVKGEDYWTEEDKEEIKNEILEAILGGEW